jgi:hypothetical protein
VDHDRRWQRVTLQQQLKARPRNGVTPVTTRQPFPPEPDHLVAESLQRFAVARYPVGAEGTPQLLPLGPMLLSPPSVSVMVMVTV